MADTDLSRLTTFQHHVNDMRNLVMCKICLKPLYEPFILACGHTYCYGCLRSWFSGLDSRRRKKNCPDCRAEVRLTPSPNYILRDLVHMFIGRAELLPEDESVDEHVAGKITEADLLAADKEGRGIFQGIFRDATNPLAEFGPLRDDGVMRCPHCFWEIEDGMCNHCGYELDEDEDYSFYGDDDDISLSHDGQSNLSDISDGSSYESELLRRDLRFQNMIDDMALENSTDNYSELDDGTPHPFAYEYGHPDDNLHGFIDDHDEDEPDEVDEDDMGAPGPRYRRSRPYQIPDDEDDSDADEEDEEELSERSERNVVANWHSGGPIDSTDISEVEDDQETYEDDSEDQIPDTDESDDSRSNTPVALPTAPARRRGPIVISDEEDEDEDEDEGEDADADEDRGDNRNDVWLGSEAGGQDHVDNGETDANENSDSDDTTIPPQSSTFRRQRLTDHRKRRRTPDAWRAVARARREELVGQQDRQEQAAVRVRETRSGNSRRAH